ncbi:AsnC family transcriptional regulator [Kitasatospora sp. NPDC094019]|uniref:AsnC family transcriptional regulator n=1 Tax=Kitasatospora sp. NPDC094019 TaxID=3364091 RepID=UPI0038219354
MDRDTVDELDQHLLRALQLDGRAPFSRIAREHDVSERTVARRYRRLRGLGLRIVGRPVSNRLGLSRWLLRLHCAPPATATIAEDLARRSDTSWVTLTADSTELYCALDAPTADEPATLLLEKLLRTPQVLTAGAHRMLHVFVGATSTWHSTRYGPRNTAAAAHSPAPPTTPLDVDTTDRILFQELARDGRATLPELAAAAHRSPSSIQRHLDRLRDAGALNLSVDFDPRLLGYRTATRIRLNVAPAHLRTVGEALATHPQIAFAAATTGTSNLVANGIFRDPAELYDYLHHRIGPLPGIHHTETAMTLREIKRLALTPA